MTAVRSSSKFGGWSAVQDPWLQLRVSDRGVGIPEGRSPPCLRGVLAGRRFQRRQAVRDRPRPGHRQAGHRKQRRRAHDPKCGQRRNRGRAVPAAGQQLNLGTPPCSRTRCLRDESRPPMNRSSRRPSRRRREPTDYSPSNGRVTLVGHFSGRVGCKHEHIRRGDVQRGGVVGWNCPQPGPG